MRSTWRRADSAPSGHLAIELFQAEARIQLRHVPYRGGAPALQDLLAGQVDGLFATAGLTVAQDSVRWSAVIEAAGIKPE